MILIPVNIEHFHWFLICADLVNSAIYVIDSMSHREEEALTEATNLKKFLSDYFHNNKHGKVKVEENLDLWNIYVPRTIPL